MANLKEAFEYAAQNPTSDFANNLKELAGSGSLDQEAKKYGIDLTPFKPKVEQPSQMSRLGTDLLNRAKTVGTQFKEIGQAEGGVETAAQVAQTPLRVVGQAAGAVGDVIGAGVNAATGGGLDKLGEYIASTETGKQLGASLLKLQQEQPELAGTLGDLFNIATVGVGGAAAKPVVKAGVTGLERGAKATLKGATKTGQFLKEGISPTPTLGKALEEATVAKTAKEIPAFEKAISAIDTTDVKTFADLNKKFKEAIPTISKQVDDELLKDPTVYKIEDLLIPQVTKAGNEIKTDYITRALDGLDDLYTKLGDDVAKADIQDLKAKANTQGLTRLEVNNLARQYNVEYGDKAFTATGDIKQGFNADVYESTRKGLKDIARSGLGGEQAKALDESLSAIYDAQRLAERNANAVQAMKTRIEEKGWVGKGIRGAFDISDLLTGGAVRALRDTVLARGNAQKLQNVLELENKLKKNLEVINKAMKAPTEAKAVEILNTLPKEKGIIGTAIDNLKDPKMRQGGYIRNPLAKKELLVQKSSSVNNTTDLLSEAKKYKTAEEFVKAQKQNPIYKNFTQDIIGKSKVTRDNLLNAPDSGRYAWRAGRDASILLDNADLPDSAFRSIVGKTREEIQKSLDDNLAKYATEKNIVPPTDIKKIDAVIKYAKETKSQLEDIWKQANQAPAEQSLLQEAKKYKTAEEFVRNRPIETDLKIARLQGVDELEKYKANGIDDMIDDDGYITLYHGGKFKGDTIKATDDELFFLTNNKDEALDYANKNKGKVIEIKTRPEFVSYNTGSNEWEISTTMRKLRDPETLEEIYAPEVTKSQLEDIWKKAQGKLPKEQK